MEYKSNTTSKIRNKIPDYVMEISYVESHNCLSAKKSLSNTLLYILMALSSYNVLFRIMYMSCKWTDTPSGFRSLYCSVSLSGGLPMLGAALYLSKITDAIMRVIINKDNAYVRLHCVVTGRDAFLCSVREKESACSASPDVAAVTWSAIHDEYSELPLRKESYRLLDTMNVAEQAGMFCRLLKIAKHGTMSPWWRDDCIYGISDGFVYMGTEDTLHCVTVFVNSGISRYDIGCYVISQEMSIPVGSGLVVCKAHGLMPCRTGGVEQCDVIAVLFRIRIADDGSLYFDTVMFPDNGDADENVARTIQSDLITAAMLVHQARTRAYKNEKYGI